MWNCRDDLVVERVQATGDIFGRNHLVALLANEDDLVANPHAGSYTEDLMELADASVELSGMLAAAAVGMGIASVGGAALILLDYLALAPLQEGSNLIATRSVALKGIALASLTAAVLLPLGAYGLVGIKRKASDDTNL